MKCADPYCGREAPPGEKYCSAICKPPPPPAPKPVGEEPKRIGRPPASLFHRIDGVEAFDALGPDESIGYFN